jgi:hypothetical protein
VATIYEIRFSLVTVALGLTAIAFPLSAVRAATAAEISRNARAS